MLKKELLKEIKEYCKENNIEDVNALVNEMLKRGFTIEKFGETPVTAKGKTETVEVVKEVIKEVIKEVPVEVIKEVPVEKIVKISDDEEVGRLLVKITELEKEIGELMDNRKRQTQAILLSNKILDETKEGYEGRVTELEEIINILKNPNQGQNRDIYGEDRKGKYGSNLLD